MAAEEALHRLLLRAGFSDVQTKKKIIPSLAAREDALETDNIGHKGNVLYIFEGKRIYLESASSQLKQRYESAMLNRRELIEKGDLLPYERVRLFAYSFFRGEIAEYNEKGQKLYAKRFRNHNALIAILKAIENFNKFKRQ